MDSHEIESARNIINEARTITVLTGAGISTDSGIPDFRGPNGIWTRDPEAEKVTDLFHYIHDSKIRHICWDTFVAADWSKYEPNAGHEAIKKLWDNRKLQKLITQNIDGLHVKSGIPENYVIELHGHLRTVTCLDCKEIFPTEKVRHDYICPKCGDFLKPDVIFFGENLNPSEWTYAYSATATCDVFLVVGTSLTVWPCADLPLVAKENGAKVIYVNGNSAPSASMVDISLIGSISDILPEIV